MNEIEDFAWTDDAFFPGRRPLRENAPVAGRISKVEEKTRF